MSTRGPRRTREAVYQNRIIWCDSRSVCRIDTRRRQRRPIVGVLVATRGVGIDCSSVAMPPGGGAAASAVAAATAATTTAGSRAAGGRRCAPPYSTRALAAAGVPRDGAVAPAAVTAAAAAMAAGGSRANRHVAAGAPPRGRRWRLRVARRVALVTSRYVRRARSRCVIDNVIWLTWLVACQSLIRTQLDQ